MEKKLVLDQEGRDEVGLMFDKLYELFDKVICAEVLEHIPDDQRAMKEFGYPW